MEFMPLALSEINTDYWAMPSQAHVLYGRPSFEDLRESSRSRPIPVSLSFVWVVYVMRKR
jgi:dihydrofolate reductase